MKSVLEAEHFYAMFNVPCTFTQAELTAGRRALALKLHPDRGGDPNEMAIVNAAFATLEDPEAHKRYRAQLRSDYPSVCAHCRGEGQVYKSKGFKARERSICSTCHGAGLTTKKEKTR